MTPVILDNLAVFRQGKDLFAFHCENIELARLDQANSAQDLESFCTDNKAELIEWSHSSPRLHRTQNPSNGNLTANINHLTINITQICNLHCSYCAAGGDGTYNDAIAKISIEKTIPQLKFFLDHCILPDFYINFLGGEPLLYPAALKAIYEYCVDYQKEGDLQFHYTITTNGTLLNTDNIQLLTELRCAINLSLDGPPEINDKLRPFKNTQTQQSSTQVVLEGLNALLVHRSKLKGVGVSSVFGSHHIDLVETYRFLQPMNLDWIDFTFSHTDSSHQASLDFVEQLHLCAEIALSIGGEPELRKIRFYNYVFEKLDLHEKTQNFCGSGKSLIVIDARNNMYTCPWQVGQKEKQVGAGLNLNLNRLEPYLKPQVDTPSCKECWARYICGGGCQFILEKEGYNNFCSRMKAMVASAFYFYQKLREEL